MQKRDQDLLREIESGALDDATSLESVLRKCIVLGSDAQNAQLRD